jgi:two-component system response regulator TtrR
VKKENALIRIVDDDASVRDALVYMLEQEGFDTVAYASAEEFLVNDMPSRPGVVVLDVRMPGMSGTRLQDEMIARRIDTPIIFLTGHGDVDMAVKALRKGAYHFLQKPVDTDELVRTLRECLEKTRRGLTAEEVRALLELLTPRERQITRLLLEGVPNHGIAVRLNLSVRTVENHRTSVYRKLRVNSYEELKNLLRGCEV